MSVSPGIGFGVFGDQHVRFALIENEARTRQAIRGIKQMFRDDGLDIPPERAPRVSPQGAGAPLGRPGGRAEDAALPVPPDEHR